MLGLRMGEIKAVIELITGYCHLGKYLSVMGKTKEEVEKPPHMSSVTVTTLKIADRSIWDQHQSISIN